MTLDSKRGDRKVSIDAFIDPRENGQMHSKSSKSKQICLLQIQSNIKILNWYPTFISAMICTLPDHAKSLVASSLLLINDVTRAVFATSFHHPLCSTYGSSNLMRNKSQCNYLPDFTPCMFIDDHVMGSRLDGACLHSTLVLLPK